MKISYWCSLLLAIGMALFLPLNSRAASPSPVQIGPGGPAAPASQASASADNKLHTDASGAFTPGLPNYIPPTGQGPGPATVSSGPPYPKQGCPPGFGYMPALTAANPTETEIFYPSFTRNANGGYDGTDTWFGYNERNAIPPGGDAWRTDLGDPATAANIAGRKIAVEVVIGETDNWPAAVPKWNLDYYQPVPGAAQGSCDNGSISYGFTQPMIWGEAPPPAPPLSVLDAPPFGVGPTLLAGVTGSWRIGTVSTLPGPGNTSRTFVHIPTCAWLDSGVPTATAFLHAITTAQSRGYTLFLVYNITVTPSGVTWNWGDGAQNTSLDAPEAGPASLPVYDAASQTWTDPCSVSHSYATVDTGRTITATESFSVHITVSWNDGVRTYMDTVPCDTSAVDCTLNIGPAQGWQSGPHPVDQIEPIPFSPTTGG